MNLFEGWLWLNYDITFLLEVGDGMPLKLEYILIYGSVMAK